MEHCNTSIRTIQPQAYDVFLGMDVDKHSIVLYTWIIWASSTPCGCRMMPNKCCTMSRIICPTNVWPLSMRLAPPGLAWPMICWPPGMRVWWSIRAGADCARVTRPHQPTGRAEIGLSITRRRFERDLGASMKYCYLREYVTLKDAYQ